MPELPEVETVRSQLSEHVVGRKVKDVDIRFSGRLNVTPRVFRRRLVGRSLKSVDRRAKLLILNFTGGESLLVHLKMTGAFRLVATGTVPGKHDHLVFHLVGPRDLFFRDLRKFGYVKLVRTEDVPEAIGKMSYGPEPLERSFGAERFIGCIRRKRTGKIKPRLLDQTCLAGIGNIYADESLWDAGILPTRETSSLSDDELIRLHVSMVRILRLAVRRRGTSADDFLDVFGKPGRNQDYLSAYGREGEPCFRCGTPITKIKLAGRGTHYCEKCQR